MAFFLLQSVCYNHFMGTLYLVATPIGNLEDMSPRAVRILREAVLIAAEDTRHTGKLLKHFEIDTPLTSYFEHNKLNKLDFILEKLSSGDVALVSDAGTPAINDPGYELVKAALASGQNVVPIPGPSAPIAAVTVSGLPTDAFLYLGYLPHKTSERHKRLEEIIGQPYTLVFLESPIPHRRIAGGYPFHPWRSQDLRRPRNDQDVRGILARECQVGQWNISSPSPRAANLRWWWKERRMMIRQPGRKTKCVRDRTGIKNGEPSQGDLHPAGEILRLEQARDLFLHQQNVIQVNQKNL